MQKIGKNFKAINSFISQNSEHLFMAVGNDVLDLTGHRFDEKIESVVSKDGILRIGTVGQVKAGKSSFINALLFDGKDMLPEAATPMTAALTVIKYSEDISAEVEFYSQADWSIIERKAKEYQDIYKKVEKKLKQNKKLLQTITKAEIESQAKARVGDAIFGSYEIYMMAQNSGLDIASHIGEAEQISDNISSIDQLLGKLQEYVGVGGRYTPITKNTNLYLNIPTLRGIEIIDTPGTNDPIVSRGQITRDFLSRCDTVFFLSYSGQFMGKEDSEFLVNTLPSEGISSIMLLGSKFDSVLIDEFKRYGGDIRSALRDLYGKLSHQANDSLGRIIASNPNKPIMDKINNKKVKFISGIAYNIAKKNRDNLDEMESHILATLQKRYNLQFTNEILLQLANIDEIRDRDLEEIKKNKKQILDSKLEDFILGQEEQVSKGLDELKKNIEQRLEEISSSSIDELSQKAKTLEDGFERARDGIEQIFVDFEFDVKEKIYSLISEISNSRADYTGVSRGQDSREVFSHTTRGGFLWLSKTRHYKTEYYEIANVNEAVDKAVKFIREANEAISHNWDRMINLADIERGLVKEATESFDLSDTSFNKSKIINPVKNALRAIKIKPYRLKDREYIDQITKAFSDDRVEGSDINQLETLLNNTLYSIVDNMEITLEQKANEISILLKEKREGFVESIKTDSYANISKLKDDLRDKESAKARDITLIEKIGRLRGDLENEIDKTSY